MSELTKKDFENVISTLEDWKSYADIVVAHHLKLDVENIRRELTPDEFLSRILLLETLSPEVDVRQRVAEVIWPQPSRWEKLRRAVLR